MNKAKLTKTQAAMLEYLKKTRNNESILQSQAKSTDELGKLPFDELVAALYVGYEIKKTPNEIIRAEYVKASAEWLGSEEGSFKDGYYQGVMHGIVDVLDTQGVKIEGVND